MRKSPKKYTKPVGSIKRKPRKKRKKAQAGQNQYALPASFQTTSTLQTLDGDPEKVQEADMSRRQLLRQQRREQRAEIDAIKAEREQNLRQSVGQATEYAAEEGAEAGKDLVKKRAAKKAAEAAAATGASAASTAGSAASNAALTGAQTLSQQGSGMAMTYGSQLSDDILASSIGTTGQAAGQAAGQTAAGAAGSAAGQVAAQGAKAGLMGSTSAAVTPIALAANVAGTAIEHFGGDEDDTTYNAAEIGGGLLAKGGEFAGYGAMLGSVVPGIGNVAGGLIGGAVGLGVGGAQMLNRKRKARAEKSERDARNEARELRASQKYDQAFKDAYTTTGQDLGFNVNQQAQNSYLGGYQMARSGGKKVPGGEVLPLSGGAVEFKGNKHFESGNGSDSGIILERSTKTKQGLEVEDGETMDKVKFADGNNDDYIFSSYLKMGGRSFADRHKEILRKGGSQKQIQQLAKMQEEKAKSVKKTPVGPTDEHGPRGKEYIARYGGLKPRRQSQADGRLDFVDPSPDGFRAAGLRREARKAEAAATKQSDRYDEYAQRVQESREGTTPSVPYDPVIGNLTGSRPTLGSASSPTGIGRSVKLDYGSTPTQQSTAPASTASAQPSQPGVQYEDALVDVGGVEYSTEDFKRKGRGASIDYSGDVNASSWGDILKTNWAETFLADNEGNVRGDLGQEEIQDIYNNQYVPQVQSYFEENPDAAYNATVAFADSGNPNASNLRKRIYNADGTLKSKEEVLEIALKNATDGKVGTFHSLFTGGESTEPEVQQVETPQGEEAVIKESEVVPDAVEAPEEVKDAVPGVKSPRLRAVPPLAYATLAGNLVGPLAALATKVPKPNLVAPSMQGRERLARVNYNAERAADLNNTTAMNRSIENSNLGPAGIVAKMAANNRSRENFMDIANQEARQNRQIDNAEKNMNQAITARNIENAYDAQVRNAGKMDAYELAKKQKNVQALADIGMSAGQFATDVMKYQRDERISTANQVGGEYTRQRYKETFQSRPKYRKMLKKAGIDPNDDRAVARIAAAAYDPNMTLEEQEQAVLDYLAANPEEEDKKLYGGRSYVKRSGSVKRKKRRK